MRGGTNYLRWGVTLSLWSKVASSHLGPVIEFAQLPTSAKTNLQMCANSAE